jgi:hypothetical protein
MFWRPCRCSKHLLITIRREYIGQGGSINIYTIFEKVAIYVFLKLNKVFTETLHNMF